MKIHTNKFARALPCRCAAFAILGVLGSLSVAQAIISLNFTYDGTDTLVEWSGTWDVSSGSGGETNFSSSSSVSFYLMPGYQYGTGSIDGPYPWSNSYSAWAIEEGALGFDSTNVYGPLGSGFTPSTVLSGSAIAANTSLSDLGFIGVSELWQSINGTLSGTGGTVNWTASYVPEPATYAGLIGILAFATVFVRGIRQKRA